MERAMTVLLHGFWGGPADWNEVLQRLPLTADVQAPDLYEASPLSPQHSLKLWTQNFGRWIDQTSPARPVDAVGYSMGGRLLLHAVLAHPEKFRRVLLVSARPFIAPEEFEERRAWEREWAEKFLTQPWSELEKTWESETVFAGSNPLKRRRDEDLRESLALSLTRWSVTEHTFVPETLKRLPPSVEFAFGALDQKFHKVAKALQDLPVQGQITQVSDAGHRLPMDAPGFITRWIENGS